MLEEEEEEEEEENSDGSAMTTCVGAMSEERANERKIERGERERGAVPSCRWCNCDRAVETTCNA
jgi:hypothetical protein